ncbi:MAG: hypothetical protein E2O44_02365 [Nitrospina sp.]|nr:MAG: hypothetical protein E2O44_02365 [Nitrospina sp.]
MSEEETQEESDLKESLVSNADTGEGVDPEEVSPSEAEVLGKNFQEMENDPLERAQKEGGEEAEFDLAAQVVEFRAQIEEEPDNCIHHYNLGEALGEMGEEAEARAELEKALACDPEEKYHSIIHFAMGNLIYVELLSGIQSIVVKSSVGLHSAHKPGSTITEVNDEDYLAPIEHFEKALKFLPKLNTDDDLVDFIGTEAPSLLANMYYKWASDLIDKSRQITKYGGEIHDVKTALKYLKKAQEIDPSHSQANLMISYAKKMLALGWKAYDEYGWEAKDIQGQE